MRFYSLFFIHCYVRNLYLESGDVCRPQHKNVQPKLRQNTELIISPCFSFLWQINILDLLMFLYRLFIACAQTKLNSG